MAQPLYRYESPISSRILPAACSDRSRGLLGDGRSRLESSPLEAVLPRLSLETNPYHLIENNRLEEIVLTPAKFN